MSRYIDTDAAMKICILIMLICIIISNYYFKKIDRPNQKEKVMSRWIDADAVKIRYRGGFHDDYVIDYDSFINAPSIDIVRCKECENGEYREDFNDYECHSSGCGLVYDADFYCADGERKK